MERLLALLKHPLIVTAVGALVGSLIIPGIVGQARTRAALAEARVNKAIEIMVSANSVNVTVNKLNTAFREFEDHVLTASPAVYEKRCDELRKTVLGLYSEFDGTAWWWPWSIYHQGRMLDLIPSDRLDDFQGHILAYMENVTSTAKLLDRPMDLYLAGDPHPGGKAAIMDELKEALEELQKKRDALAQLMAAEFQWDRTRQSENDTGRRK